MNQIFFPAKSRGHNNLGWLDSYHSFSFGGYYNPQRVQFGMLRVLNDDVIEGGTGFGRHPHDNMEIISIPLKGSLKHQDSTGTSAIIRENEVQIMSAGTGIEHSEQNNSHNESCNFLQIWILPKEKNIKPRYDQKIFDYEGNKNNFILVVSPDEHRQNSLWINQDAFLSIGYFKELNDVNYNLHNGKNGVFLFILEGSCLINDQELNKRDALGISEANDLVIQIKDIDTRILIIEVPM